MHLSMLDGRNAHTLSLMHTHHPVAFSLFMETHLALLLQAGELTSKSAWPSFCNSSASLGFTFRSPLSRRQDLMETLTPRENWYCRSPSRSGIPRLWSGRDATGISSSSRCLWSLARKWKTQTDAASTCTRASSLWVMSCLKWLYLFFIPKNCCYWARPNTSCGLSGHANNTASKWTKHICLS